MTIKTYTEVEKISLCYNKYMFKLYSKLPLKSCLYSILEVDTISLSIFLGTSMVSNWQVSVHSCTTDTAFKIDEDLVVNTILLSSSRGQSISLVICSPQGDCRFCRPLRIHRVRPSVILQQARRIP